MGKKTLIIGDVGTGKTVLTRGLLDEALESTDSSITVLDFAPPSVTIDGRKIGGYIYTETNPRVRVIKSGAVKTPRLSANNGDELMVFASQNRDVTEGLIEQYLASPSDILFVNDVSIHLQQGNLVELWKAFTSTDTVIANGYVGEYLKEDYDTEVSEHEYVMMRQLASRVDRVIKLEGEIE